MTDILDRAVTGSGLVPAFQPVVSLPSESIVGYEALARWPHLDGVTPTQALAHAQATGKLERLDHECIRRAARGALHGAFVPGMLLFINCEPTTAHVDLSTEASVGEAARSLNLVFELTERGLAADPQALLRKVDALRSLGYMIALDDVGAHPDSLALLDIVAPDIVKLDMGLVQRRPDRAQARTVAAVSAYAERTGATILAEGIETNEHLNRGLAFGATLGQGFRFGRPGDLATVPDACVRPSWKPRPPAPGRGVGSGVRRPGPTKWSGAYAVSVMNTYAQDSDSISSRRHGDPCTIEGDRHLEASVIVGWIGMHCLSAVFPGDQPRRCIGAQHQDSPH